MKHVYKNEEIDQIILDESLILSIRPLINKLSGAVTGAIVGFTAVWVGMSGGATVDTVTAANKATFEMIMFATPIVFLIVATLIYKTKVKLTEEKHAEIVRELERTWGKDRCFDIWF